MADLESLHVDQITAGSITATALVPDMSNDEYHASPGLSSTGAKTINTCPAQFHWERSHPVHKAAYDFGSVAHELVLGKGDGFEVIEAANWMTKVAKEARDAARAAGLVPILAKDFKRAEALAQSVLRNPETGRLFASGAAETSVFATDPDTGVQVRCRPDWLTENLHGRPICLDLKTTAGGTHPRDVLGKYGVINKLGYHQSAAWYLDTLALCGIEDAQFLLVFVSKEAPHEPRVVLLDDDSLDEGRRLNRQALETFANCTERGEWPCAHPTFITGSIYEREAV